MNFDLEFPFPADVFKLPVQQALAQEPPQEPQRVTAISLHNEGTVFLVVNEEGLFEQVPFDRCKAVKLVKPTIGVTKA